MKNIAYWGATRDPAKHMPAVVGRMLKHGNGEEGGHRVLGVNFKRVVEPVGRVRVPSRRERVMEDGKTYRDRF